MKSNDSRFTFSTLRSRKDKVTAGHLFSLNQSVLNNIHNKLFKILNLSHGLPCPEHHISNIILNNMICLTHRLTQVTLTLNCVYCTAIKVTSRQWLLSESCNSKQPTKGLPPIKLKKKLHSSTYLLENTWGGHSYHMSTGLDMRNITVNEQWYTQPSWNLHFS